MIFESPWYLLLLLTIPIYLLLKYKRFRKGKLNINPSLLFSSTDLFSKRNTRVGMFFDILGDGLLSLSLFFLIVALARPLGGQDISQEKTYGIDIVLTIDVSGSMLFIDQVPPGTPFRYVLGQKLYTDPNHKLIQYNRLNSAKKVISQYIKKQKFNRIGVVIFGGYSYTQCPLTLDKNMLLQIIDGIEYNINNDGTAIGMGIATSINRLRKSEAKSKVIILLTDGVNNAGMIDPISAAQIARDMGIRIYTIGVGNPQGYLTPRNIYTLNEYVVNNEIGFDEKVLSEIANITGGKFYKAEDPDSLKQIYDDIDQLEKSKIEIKQRVLYKENFMPFLVIGAIILGMYILLTNLVIKIP